jgi:hypothetical protein
MKKKSLLFWVFFISSVLLLSLNFSPAQASQGEINGIKSYLSEKKSAFTDYTEMLDEYAQKYDVDPRLAIAIAGAESQFGKDTTGQNCMLHYNPWNLMSNNSCMKFDNWEESFNQIFAQLRKYREKENLTTIEAIQPKYCTSGCDNWITNVKSFYQEQGGNADSNDLTYPFDLGTNGVDLWQYCLTKWGNQADKNQPVTLDGNDAYSWHCSINGGQKQGISVNEACEWQFSSLYVTQSPSGTYAAPQIYSRTDNSNDPYSWRCYYR